MIPWYLVVGRLLTHLLSLDPVKPIGSSGVSQVFKQLAEEVGLEGGRGRTMAMTVSKLRNHSVTKMIPPKTKHRKVLELDSLK